MESQSERQLGRRQSASRSPLILMALTIFIDFTGFGLVIPLLPFWAERLGAGPGQIGALLAAYALAQLLFTPILGALSDRLGRRPVILASLLLESFAFALTALAGSLTLLVLARFVGGLGASNIGSAQAVVADLTPPEHRARAMGMIGAAIGLGFVVGPALGGVLVVFGQAMPFWAAMGVALLNAFLVWRLLPETRQLPSQVDATTGTSLAARGTRRLGWGQALRSPAVARLVAINLLYTLAFAGMETVFVLLTQRTFGWRAQQNGYLFAYIGVIVVVMQGGLVGGLVAWFGERCLLIAGLFLLATGLFLLPWSTTLAQLLAALGLLSVGDGAVTPTVSSLLSLAAPADAQGEVLGLAQGLGGFGRFLGPLAAGSLFALGMSLPFILGGALALGGVLLAFPALPERVSAPSVSVPRATRWSATPIVHHSPERNTHPMQPTPNFPAAQDFLPSSKPQVSHRRMRQGFILASGLLALAILLQVFLAGGGLFADASLLPMHRMFGMMLSLGPVLLLALGLAARLPRRTLLWNGLLLVLIGLQPVLISAPEQLAMPVLKAFHLVNALLIFALTIFLGQLAQRSAAPSPANPRA